MTSLMTLHDKQAQMSFEHVMKSWIRQRDMSRRSKLLNYVMKSLTNNKSLTDMERQSSPLKKDAIRSLTAERKLSSHTFLKVLSQDELNLRLKCKPWPPNNNSERNESVSKQSESLIIGHFKNRMYAVGGGALSFLVSLFSAEPMKRGRVCKNIVENGMNALQRYSTPTFKNACAGFWRLTPHLYWSVCLIFCVFQALMFCNDMSRCCQSHSHEAKRFFGGGAFQSGVPTRNPNLCWQLHREEYLSFCAVRFLLWVQVGGETISPLCRWKRLIHLPNDRFSQTASVGEHFLCHMYRHLSKQRAKQWCPDSTKWAMKKK